MPAPNTFEYAVIRVVARVERQEFINAGLILFCRTLAFLDVRLDLKLERLAYLSPTADADMIRRQLQAIKTICDGGPQAGYFGNLSQSERFNWLVAPCSSIIQASPVHSGISENPATSLEALYRLMVE